MSPANPKTILFLGATGGCGLSALRRSLDAGFTCIALCRTPSKLASVLLPEQYPNLRIAQGNAHEAHVVARHLVSPLDPTPASLTPSSPPLAHGSTCGMAVLLDALKNLRTEKGVSGNPRILGLSSTGISKFGRDTPLLIAPLYKGLLHVPHEDKRAMEELLFASNEAWTVVRASLLTNGKEQPPGAVRVGLEDPSKGVEQLAIGYTISREDVGRWIFENVLQKDGNDEFVRKVATITY
ncbi:hypothetical protein LY78DRAFT_683251 [Colletotrichum sublineola]|uniref:NAD(P)-binding domain-containing protein n=1 Tax=Colletotrichum sublineola TaxID=1173701 RepID=A0A066XI02_COLSU|nr:hypothetical protein LY78DRAFT_683251 [Colletotrichum sublineola]KDN65640.1 hypothetical protein CSUB01_05416 [Colletotrichum sublineola]